MKKAHLIIALSAGGFALFLLSIFIILAAKGQLNNQTLTRVPIIGRFFGSPVPIIVNMPSEKDAKTEESEAAKRLPKETLPPMAHFNLPSPFSPKELTDLSLQLEETKDRYEKKLEEATHKEEDLVRREKDVEARWNELNALATKVEEARKKLDADFKSFQRGKSEFEADEQANITKMAALFQEMESNQKISELLEPQGADKASRILEEIRKENAEKASGILAAMPSKFAQEIIAVNLKRKKTTPAE